jgi:hypothetical protein
MNFAPGLHPCLKKVVRGDVVHFTAYEVRFIGSIIEWSDSYRDDLGNLTSVPIVYIEGSRSLLHPTLDKPTKIIKKK